MPLNPPITDWRGQRVWLIGASSGIGQATAAALHARGAEVWLSARQADALHAFVQAHPGSHALVLDATDPAAMRQAADTVFAQGPLDLVLYCAGYYRPLRALDYDLAQMLQHEQVNYVGALYLLDAVLPRLLTQRHGHISLVSSVAGYRGLPQSLAYGPTKAALIHLAEALYLDLHPLGLGVSVVNPGFVDTPLTAQNQFAMPSLMSAADAAQAMLRGWGQGRFELHFPRRFTALMHLLRLLPYSLYFPLVRRGTGL